MNSCDSAERTENNSQQVNLKSFTCSLCVQHFPSEKQYYGHLRIHTGEVLLTCDQCPESEIKYDSQAKLKIHENMCHNIVRPFKCQECGLFFDRASQLENHQRSVHFGEKSHICQICEKGFFRKTDLRTHLNIHLGTNISMCEICGKKFNHVSNLIRHCRTHAGIKPYPCTICGKRFTQVSSLARHKRIHERVKKVDDINSRQTLNSSESNLNDHVSESREITKDVGTSQHKIIKRRHYCKICGESFQFTVLLRKHEKEHIDSDKVFECKNCKKKFQNPVDIKEHSCRKVPFTPKVDEKPHKSRSKTQKLILDERNVFKHVESTDVQDYSIFSKDLTPELIDGEQTMETVFYVKAKQKAHINQTEFEEVSSHFFRDHAMELANISDLLNICNSENVDLEKQIDHLNDYSEMNDLVSEVPKLLNAEISSVSQADVENYNSRKQISKTNLKYRQIEETNVNFKENTLQFEENIARTQYILNTESQDSATDLELESVDPKEILTDNEPTLRLVQIETGEQFYELVMDNISEKPPSQNSISLENSQETGNDPVESLQDLELFRTDVQSNFEVYTEANFADYNKTSYGNCTEEFLELVESEKPKEGETICHAENADQFLEFIENPGFTQISHKEKEDVSIKDIALEDASSSVARDDDTAQNPIGNEIKKVKSGKDKSSEKEKSNKEFHCYVCQKTLSSKYNFTQHMGTHYENHQRFHCKECGLSFAWKSTLNKHNESHHRPEGRQTYVCNICPKVYNNLCQVNEHVKRDHLKERKHVCPLCEKSFFKKFDLKSHFRTHTNEKPYQCSSCEKRFHYQSHVIRHERVHSGEKPYICDICQRSFCQRGSLKAHRQKHRPMKIDIFKKYQMDEDDPIELFT